MWGGGSCKVMCNLVQIVKGSFMDKIQCIGIVEYLSMAKHEKA